MPNALGLNAKLHVLVVDDQEPSRVLSKFALMELGFENVHEAEDGKRAMEYVAKAFRTGNNVDLILCDHEMPEVDGFQFYRILRESNVYRDTPFIMVTSHSEAPLVQAMADAGVKDFIVKPINSRVLGEKIVKLLLRK